MHMGFISKKRSYLYFALCYRGSILFLGSGVASSSGSTLLIFVPDFFEKSILKVDMTKFDC